MEQSEKSYGSTSKTLSFVSGKMIHCTNSKSYKQVCLFFRLNDDRFCSFISTKLKTAYNEFKYLEEVTLW